MIDLTPRKAMIEAALAKGGEGKTFEDVQEAVASGRATVWLSENSVAITETVTTMHVWVFAGNLKENAEMAIDAEAHARNLGYEQMSVREPRKGWDKPLKALGYEPQTVYVKGLR